MTTPFHTRPNPYVGPRAFQYGETLYGRDREVMELLDLLIAERIVLLYSPSGAGKTSLIQAALIPELEGEGFQVLPVMRVGLEPPSDLYENVLPPTANRYVLSLLLSLEEALPPEQQTPLIELAKMTLTDYLDRRQVTASQPTFQPFVLGPKDQGPSNLPTSTVLILDQFEEILTADPTDRAAKEVFFAQVGAALRDRRRWALFAMREDYLAGLDPYLRPLPTRLSTTYRLELLGKEAALEAIEKPARQAGVDFYPAAAGKLADDLRRVRVQRPDGTTKEQLGPHVEPVQLQVVCRRLWTNLPAGATQIEEADTEAVGDVDSALSGYYAERVAAIAGETGVRERAVREWFDRGLVTEQGIRGQVLQGPERSEGLDNRAIWPLVDAHLVRAEKRRGATWFELAHDRLIEPVRADNGAWREAHLSALQRQAALWESQGRPDGLLLRDQALEEAEAWAATHDDELTSPERDFLEDCREARAIAEREQRQARRIRWLAVGATIFGLIAIVLAVFAWGQLQATEVERQRADRERVKALAAAEAEATARQQAEQQRRVAQSRALAAQAEVVPDQELAVLLGLEAVLQTHHHAPGTMTAEAVEAVHQAVARSRCRSAVHGGEANGVEAVHQAVARSRWLVTFSGHSGPVVHAAWSSDDRRIVTAS